ncbi:MAG: hypothetical protein M2R45_02870 [Verrucomicrobia subdivision 3 bacterium]|nr:hypothetical protein [Limisphaerales bacterium]MCS1414722.1 hypothetical protein [Limisphaerales bacterium]
MFLAHARKCRWDDWQSISYDYIKQAQMPIVIFHGKDDPRVYPSQSLDFYRALKAIGKVPIRLEWHPVEDPWQSQGDEV